MSMLALLFAAAAALPQPTVTRVADDARVVDRVAEVSKGDLPQDLLKRLVNDDIDLLRGKRADGTYLFAGYERLEAGRITRSFSIEPAGEGDLKRVESKGDFVYRVILDIPTRRLVVRHNNPLYIDHVEIESMPQGTSTLKTQTAKVEAWMQPGEVKPIELDEIGRSATVRVFGRADSKKGYGNISIVLLQAKVIDNSDSPYADAVESEKAILRGVDKSDIGSIRAMAQRIVSNLRPAAAAATVEVAATPCPPVTPAAMPALATAAPSTPAPVAAPGAASALTAETLPELQMIEDLLTGTDAEKLQARDRLHQLIRRMRGQ